MRFERFPLPLPLCLIVACWASAVPHALLAQLRDSLSGREARVIQLAPHRVSSGRLEALFGDTLVVGVRYENHFIPLGPSDTIQLLQSHRAHTLLGVLAGGTVGLLVGNRVLSYKCPQSRISGGCQDQSPDRTGMILYALGGVVLGGAVGHALGHTVWLTVSLPDLRAAPARSSNPSR